MSLNHITSVWDRYNRNIINEMIDVVNQQGKSMQDLIASGQLTPEQYADLLIAINSLVKKGEISQYDLNAELRTELSKINNKINKGEVAPNDLNAELSNEISKINNKLDKGNVTVSDIDKNKGKLDQTYMSETFLQQMAGNTPINAVPADGSVTPIKISTDSNGINKGKVYPLKVVWRDGALEPYDTEISNVILSAKVIGARKDKMYSIRYIANGNGGYYGISLVEWDKTPGGGIVSAGIRTLIDYKDASFNHNEPSGNIVHRTIHIPNEDLSFEIIYDRSEIKGFGLDIANTALGKGRSAIIHPENYVYRMGTESVNNTSNSKVFMEKKADRFFVYKPVSNGNYVGHEITYYERGIDTENALSNYKLWCVRTIKEYSRSGDSFTPVRSIIDHSTPTTMDLMIKESDDMDYMGGIHHGDEINDFAMLLVDGKPIDLSATGFYEAKEVRLIQRNKLYRDTVYTDGVLEHLGTVGKEHVFNYEDGYTLHNRVTWHESINIVQAFLGSLSMYRKDEKGNSPLWHTAINDITHTPYDLKTIGGQMPIAENVERVILTGEKLSCVVEIDRLDNIPDNPTWVANFAEHNSKLYISYVPAGYTTSVDEVWKQSTKFNFELGD